MRLVDADELIDLIERMKSYHQDANDICEMIQNLATIEPQRKKGKWISADAMFGGIPFYCSECGENTRDTVMGEPRWNFCPMCGARNVKE